jgi:glycosyltransferase involved in cell wall biosynthesis
VEEGETGYYVPPGDATSLADRLARLQRDPDLRLRMGEKGRRRVETRFNGEKIAADLVDLMKRAAASRAGRDAASFSPRVGSAGTGAHRRGGIA